MYYLLKMVIFHCYVSLPEGILEMIFDFKGLSCYLRTFTHTPKRIPSPKSGAEKKSLLKVESDFFSHPGSFSKDQYIVIVSLTWEFHNPTLHHIYITSALVCTTHPKDHWTLKTGFFEDPTPAIQVQTLPLEGPRSLGQLLILDPNLLNLSRYYDSGRPAKQ